MEALAGLAVVLAVLRMYGLISHEVELSKRDIGIKLALGASGGWILEGIYRRVGWMLGVGVVLGLVVTVVAEKFISAVVTVGIAKDGVLIAALAVGLMGVGLLAAAVPARRASGVEPMEALREE